MPTAMIDGEALATRSGNGYVFDTRFPEENERLELGEALWDRGTIERLMSLGVGPGWACLEVGAGRGSVARWLAETVGPAGEVVATDLRVDRLKWLVDLGVAVRRHDVAVDELPERRFDLIHGRLLIQHVIDRRAAVDRLCRALRPGGYLVLEDTDATSLFSHPSRERFQQKVKRAAYEVMRDAGYHPRCGLLDIDLAMGAGLADVRAEGRAAVVGGGTDAARWFTLWIEHLRPAMVARGSVTEAEIEQALSELADPANHWLSQVMVTVIGRKPK